ncbi:GNAT family N-acetyltransferase [Enterovibrio norvegicus]|uniref:GNAT family N-acetyltransferase n=1 Tax=Enterovibrio norvegicus TaxID=188144 RepID=UPI000C835E08|nr:GNAT family N-acetyltransferase [Enterovibrio norvegicus]PMN64341.1 hypothetical protein BCT27_10285 [Enterovibrio norvegicus]
MDYLVPLYNTAFISQEYIANEITIRKPIGPEKDTVLSWIEATFSMGWRCEAETAYCHSNGLYIALKGGRICGFASFDGTAKGYFGPMGVSPEWRGCGVGQSLLCVTLRAMQDAGYGYAVIPTNSHAYYAQYLELFEIPNSEKGIYHDMLPIV